MPQDCVLFNESIEYNIGFGKIGTGEIATKEEVSTAAEHAQFDEFVKRQRWKPRILVGERVYDSAAAKSSASPSPAHS